MSSHPNSETVDFAGHRCMRLTNRFGTAVIAFHGAHLLSWIPAGLGEVFWLSPQALAEPATIRGGVPVCWPWFGKQGMPDGALAHGLVRNRRWDITTIPNADTTSVTGSNRSESVAVLCVPTRLRDVDGVSDPIQRHAPYLDVSLRIELGDSLTHTLLTHNRGPRPFVMTQALHSYFAVQDATQVHIEGLDGLAYVDKLSTNQEAVQPGPCVLELPCDRVYLQRNTTQHHQYTLVDTLAQRRIHISTEGSQSVVVWNPGPSGAVQLMDVPDGAWRGFFCVEAANAGVDHILLPPGGHHRLTQRVGVALR